MKKNILKRTTSALILLAIIVPFFLTTNLLKNDYGEVIGIIFYIIFSLVATMEIIAWNGLNLIFNIILCLLSATIWFIPNSIFKNGAYSFELQKIINLFIWQNFSNSIIISLIIIASTTIFFFLISKRKSFTKFFMTFFALIYIPLFLKFLYLYNRINIYLFACIFLIPIIVDTSAYFGGMLLGHKIIKKPFSPHISPKKTWEGAIISYLLGTLCVYLLMYLPKNNMNYIVFTKITQVVIGMIFLPFLSIIGDLLFSYIKRKIKIKDYSNLIPGHGGLMDRFDSTSLVTIGTTLILLF